MSRFFIDKSALSYRIRARAEDRNWRGPFAEVAELVDALGSGPSGGNTVGVRVPSSAPNPDLNALRSFASGAALATSGGERFAAARRGVADRGDAVEPAVEELERVHDLQLEEVDPGQR